MPSRSPSRRSSLSPRSRASSNRSPSFGLHGNSRRGRSPPAEPRRHRILTRGSGTRSDASIRGSRNSEMRHAPRSTPAGSYPPGQYAGIPQQSPRRVAAPMRKKRTYSPTLPVVVPSTSGIKRKYVPHPRSSSSSSSSPPRPKHRPLPVERMAASREPPIEIPVRKQSRAKSPVRERGHSVRASTQFSVRDADGMFDMVPVSKKTAYPVVDRTAGPAVVIRRSIDTSPSRVETPQKRFLAAPVVHYTENVKIGESRPTYRGPNKAESTSYSDRELKQIKVGIRQNVRVGETQINRKIVNPEDIVIVRRPDGSLAAVGVHDGMYRMVSIRTDSGEVVEALCKVPSGKVEVGDVKPEGDEQNHSNDANGYEGRKPIFEREELREVINSADDGEGKYVERERTQLSYRSSVQERLVSQRMQPLEHREVAIVDDEDPLTETAMLRSLRGKSHRSRSPLSPSRTGDSRLESISPHPLPSMERPSRRGASYYNTSPSPPPRIASGFGSGRSRNFAQAGPSHAAPSGSSQTRHKAGRHSEDLRYELEYRRRDDSSYERAHRELRNDSDGTSGDLRMRINEKRTSDHHRASHYDSDDDAPMTHPKVIGERGYPVEHRRGDVPHEQRRRGVERASGHREIRQVEHEEVVHDEFQQGGSFHNKSSSSSIPSWDGNPEYVPKGRAYYEHDNRDEEWVRLRGGGGSGGAPRGGRGGRSFSAMGGRGRMYRGGFNPRGRGRGRGGRNFYPGGGRGYNRGGGGGSGGGGGRRGVTRGAAGMGGSNSSSRGKSTSPNLWKHDMFENLSSDENRPTSTSEMKR